MQSRSFNYDYCGGNNSCFRNLERINCPEKLKKKVVLKDDEIIRRESTGEPYKEVKIPLNINPYPTGGIITDNAPTQLFLPYFKTHSYENLSKDFRKRKELNDEIDMDMFPVNDQELGLNEQKRSNPAQFTDEKYLSGYEDRKKPHPFYTTTSMDYGYHPVIQGGSLMSLNRHHPRRNHFKGQTTDFLYRNRSLNVNIH